MFLVRAARERRQRTADTRGRNRRRKSRSDLRLRTSFDHGAYLAAGNAVPSSRRERYPNADKCDLATLDDFFLKKNRLRVRREVDTHGPGDVPVGYPYGRRDFAHRTRDVREVDGREVEG